MARANECKECGNSMSQFFKGDYCGDACRQAKARRKRNLGKTAIRIRRDIATLTKAANDGQIEWYDLLQERNRIVEALNLLTDASNTLYEREQSELARHKSSE